MEHIEYRNVVAAQCRRLRDRLDWTQDELAAHCQHLNWIISRSTVAKIETGHRRVNDAEVALLAKALRTTPNDLLDVPAALLANTARQGASTDTNLDLMAAEKEEG